jgi:hypothetical protein
MEYYKYKKSGRVHIRELSAYPDWTCCSIFLGRIGNDSYRTYGFSKVSKWYWERHYCKTCKKMLPKVVVNLLLRNEYLDE